MRKEHIICRCEEVTREEIEESVSLGDASLSAVKKRTRAGMGYCQGKTCKRLVAALIREGAGIPIEDLLPGSIRMPVGAVSLEQLAAAEGAEENE
jgi:bacterioferritin-associated ferredoxin